MKVLIACEESGRVVSEFLKMGFDAYSCDILPTSGEHPERHFCQDVIPLLKEPWDLVIGFPPCTYLTITGNRWFNRSLYGEKAIQREKEREKAIDFFLKIAEANSPYIAIENPVGVMSTVWREPDQIIEPYFFGDPQEKQTCLWLKGLPPLKPSNMVKPEGRWYYIDKNKKIKSQPDWYRKTWNLPRAERAKIRSKTFPGLAKAMADQWGGYIRAHPKRETGKTQIYIQGNLF